MFLFWNGQIISIGNYAHHNCFKTLLHISLITAENNTHMLIFFKRRTTSTFKILCYSYVQCIKLPYCLCKIILLYVHNTRFFLCSCAFLPNNGGFFIGYIITAAFIGTALEWVRIPQFVQYLHRRCVAKSCLQRTYANEVC